ncbi:hypothetical protein [Solicola gregarius]|uniref:Uncharacterized protein n=1 Tax=Solicola gregarius TaxID=2908642 RepID=A0AA46TGA9_9ACTN|nr:hypothetical protein [Solicola gregarius]UYM04786.1 hypothetical protein L0C25_19970 [Solicola gregarius]
MFDHVMWVAYLCTGAACGLLGLAFAQLAARGTQDSRPLHAGGIALYSCGSACAWIAALVGLPGHTSQVIAVTALIVVIVVVAMVAAAAPVRGVREGGTRSDGAP